MKNQTTKLLLLTCLCMMFFTSITHAQCTSSSLNVTDLTAGQKVILTEISKEDNPEIHKSMVGKTLTVGKAGLTNIGDCWFMGELNIKGEDVFFIGVRLDAAKGENYKATTPSVAAETKTAAAFPVGCRVTIVKPNDEPYSLLSALSDESTPNETGTVVEADLKPLGDNWYSGKVKIDKGEVRTFAKAQFQSVK